MGVDLDLEFTWQLGVCLAAAYLLGSIPFGVLIARWKAGIDPRSGGSGNIGATNVARVAGKKLGLVTLVLDALKGVAAVLLALWLLPGKPAEHAAVGLLAFLGHVCPVWLRFRGGKGVATALGVLLTLVPLAALVGFAIYAAIFATLRVSSVGSLLGAIGAVTAAFLLDGPREYAALCLTLLLMMLFTHRANLRRIWSRTEKAL